MGSSKPANVHPSAVSGNQQWYSRLMQYEYNCWATTPKRYAFTVQGFEKGFVAENIWNLRRIAINITPAQINKVSETEKRKKSAENMPKLSIWWGETVLSAMGREGWCIDDGLKIDYWWTRLAVYIVRCDGTTPLHHKWSPRRHSQGECIITFG